MQTIYYTFFHLIQMVVQVRPGTSKAAQASCVKTTLKEIAELNMRLNLYRQVKKIKPPDKDANDCISQTIPKEIQDILKDRPQLARQCFFKK